ncbi:MAG: hypothetical protein ACLTW7_15025 [Enterococcus sp.]|uniref:Uncharacterized protein n=1 Tax=Enterococcus italicus (strain DSM 15952 / CCUG 50447 / LMG 22039 / TP 1.5) TaxID=888064 RepID=E6LIS4_ENTI1|nr:hypothetical protein [Enterococcus italicus]EFU72895.1 hypothetical protein HMPREF9088_2264 [Enterococcus italicus DSM 15952]
MKSIFKVLLVSSLLFSSGFFLTTDATASEVYDTSSSQSLPQGQPVNFDNIQDINEVVQLIDGYYYGYGSDGISLRAAPGTKWGEGTVEYIGQGSQLVTNYFWVKGSSMSSLNVVGNAERKAVIAKYGSVNNNTSYKMKTQQKINMSPQTQGYVTVSAQAWCYGRD